jgi:cell wall-associated NlpC family hydrolase
MAGKPALAALVLSLIVSGCASTGATPRPFPLPGGYPAASAPATTGAAVPAAEAFPRRTAATRTADGYSISSTALSLRGSPYRDGGTDPAGFDCSGFVKYVFEQHGVAMPRDVSRQFQVGDEIDASTLAPGDLVFFSTVSHGASHVGIVVGGDQFVHAPSSNGVVRVDHLSSDYWASRFIGAKRVN